MQPLNKQQIDAIVEFLNDWPQTRGTVVPLRLKEHFAGENWQEWYGAKKPKIDLNGPFVRAAQPDTSYGSSLLPKITDLSNTKIWVGDNEELSEKIQRRAFELGWFHKEKYDYMKKRIAKDCNFFIFVDTDIFCGKLETKEDLKDTPQIEIFPEQILDGKTWLEKMDEAKLKQLKKQGEMIDKDYDKYLEHLKNQRHDWQIRPHMQEGETPDECVDRLRREFAEAPNEKDHENHKPISEEESNGAFMIGAPKMGVCGSDMDSKSKDLQEKPKAYILQKDLPYCKAGTKWTKANDYDEYNFNGGSKWMAIPSENMERIDRNWIEWFLPGEKNSLFSKIKYIIERHCDGTYRDVESWNFANPNSDPASILCEIETIL